MKIVFDEKSGGYYAYSKPAQGKPCIGYSESRLEAEQFCFELIEKNRYQPLGESE